MKPNKWRLFFLSCGKVNKDKKCSFLKGFTLVEMLVAVSIFVILVFSVLAVLIAGQRVWDDGETQMDIQFEARRIMQRMSEELTYANPDNITISDTQDAITFIVPSSYNYTTGNIEWGNQIQYFLGGANGHTLLRREGANTAVIGRNVSSVRFTLNGDRVGIQLVLSKQSPSRNNLQVELNSQVSLRN